MIQFFLFAWTLFLLAVAAIVTDRWCAHIHFLTSIIFVAISLNLFFLLSFFFWFNSSNSVVKTLGRLFKFTSMKKKVFLYCYFSYQMKANFIFSFSSQLNLCGGTVYVEHFNKFTLKHYIYGKIKNFNLTLIISNVANFDRRK